MWQLVMSVHMIKLKDLTNTNTQYTMQNTQIQILPGGDVSAREQEVQGLQEWNLQ